MPRCSGDFRNRTLNHFGVTSTFSKRDGKFVVRTDGPDGKLNDYEVIYTFGVHPLQQYIVALPNGRWQALPLAWDTRPREAGGQRWFHLNPDEPIPPGDLLHWTGIANNWNHMCAECHSTNVRKGFDETTDRYDTTWSELNVGCEACHGPGSNHVAWAQRRRGSARGRRRSRSSTSVATAPPGPWTPQPASLGAASPGGRTSRSRPAAGATPGAASSARTTSGVARCSTPTASRSWATRSTMRTVSSRTRSTSTARSCRAGCTPPASPAPTATMRTARSYAASPTTRARCARAATCRRRSPHRRTIIIPRALPAPAASPATCPSAPTWWSTGVTITASAFPVPTCR